LNVASWSGLPFLWLLRSSEGVDINDGLGKALRSFLRQIVPDAAIDGPVRVLAREFAGIGAGLRVWRAVGIAFEGNGGQSNDRI
jgi:hypothetical protein